MTSSIPPPMSAEDHTIVSKIINIRKSVHPTVRHFLMILAKHSLDARFIQNLYLDSSTDITTKLLYDLLLLGCQEGRNWVMKDGFMGKQSRTAEKARKSLDERLKVLREASEKKWPAVEVLTSSSGTSRNDKFCDEVLDREDEKCAITNARLDCEAAHIFPRTPVFVKSPNGSPF